MPRPAAEGIRPIPMMRSNHTDILAEVSDLTIKDVVDAYFDAEKYRRWNEKMSGYYNLQRDILVTLFECPLPPHDTNSGASDDHERDRDRQAVASTAHHCLTRASTPLSPFGWYLEGAPGPMEARVLAVHRRKFDSAETVVQEQYRRIFRTALDLLHPEASSRTFPRSVLFERGLPGEKPDEMDFW